MPIVNPSKAKSNLDYSGPVQPDLNYGTRYAEKSGSKDTYLSRLGLFGYGGGSYDRYYNPWNDQGQQRFNNETNTQALGNSLAKLGLKTATGLPQVAGGLTSLVASPFVVAGGGTFMDAFDRNPLIEFSDWASHAIDEVTPKMYSASFNQKNFGAQITQDPGQLAAESVDSLAFLAQSIIGGAAVSKLGLGARLVSKFATMNGLTDVLAGAGARGLSKMAATIDGIAANSVLTTSEAAMEAADAKKQFKQQMTEKMKETGEYPGEEKIDQMADEKAKSVFWLNVGVLAVTNGAFIKLLKPFRGKVPLSSTANELGLRLVGDEFQATTHSGIRRLISSKVDFTPVMLRSVLENVVSEGMEESLQHSIQKINAIDAGATDAKSVAGRMLKEINPLNPDGAFLGVINDKERGKAFGLGALIGGLSPIVMARSTARNLEKQRDYRDKVIKDLNDSYTDMLSGSVHEKTDDKQVSVKAEEVNGQMTYTHTDGTATTVMSEDDYNALIQQHNLPKEGGSFIEKGKYVLDPSGNPVISPAKLARAVSDAQYHAELDHLIDSETLRNKADETKLKLFKAMKLARLAKTAFDAGVGDILSERFDNISEDDKAIEKYGIEKEDIDSYKEQLKTFQNIYDNVSQDAISTFSDYETNEERKAKLFDLGVRAATYTRLRDKEKLNAERLGMELKQRAPINLMQRMDEAIEASTNLGYHEAKTEEYFSEYDDMVRANQDGNLRAVQEKIEREATSADEAKEKLKDYGDVLSKVETTELEKLVHSGVRSRQLDEAIVETKNAYDATRSLKAFKEDKKIAQTRSTALPSKINFNPSTTTKFFDLFEEREAKRLMYRDKFDVVSKEFYSELIAVALDNIQKATDPMEQVQIAVALLEQIDKNKPRLYATDALALKNGFAQNIAFVERVYKEAEDDGYNIDDEFEDDLTDDQLLAQAIRNTLGNYSDMTKIDAILDPLVRTPQALKTDEEIRRSILDNIIKPSDSIIEQFHSDEESYEDIASVDYEMEQLTHAARVIKSKGGMYADSAQAMEDTAKYLEDVVRPQVIKNLANKELKNIRQNKLYGQAFSQMVKSAQIRDVLQSVVNLQSLDQLMIDDPYLGHLAFTEALSRADKAKATKALEEHKDVVLNSLDSLQLSQTLPSEIRELFVTSPTRALQYVITKYLSISATRKTEDPLVTKFKNDYDLVELVSAVDPSTELGKLIDVYLQAYALVDAQRTMKSKLSSVQILTRLKAFVNAQKADNKPAPSVAQERVVLQMAHFLTSTTDKPVVGANTMALKAPPGAGKSLLVVPAALAVAGIQPSKVVTAAPLQKAAENIQQSTKSAQPVRTFDDLIKALNEAAIPEDTEVIILDEATATSFGKLHEVLTAHARYLNNNPQAKSKLVLIYDPNQGNASDTGVPMLASESYSVPTVLNTLSGLSGRNVERAKALNKTGFTEEDYMNGVAEASDEGKFAYAQNIYDVLPLAVTYRSDVPQIIALQKAFLSRTSVGAVESSASVDPRASTKDIVGTFNEAGTANLANILRRSIADNPTRSKVIIVGSEQDKARYQEFAANAEILTAQEAIGITRDEVYVDIKVSDQARYQRPVVYNQAVYTATSRAKEFLYIGNTPGSFSVDSNIAQKVAANAQYKVDRHGASLKEKEDQIQTIDSLMTAPAATKAAPATPTQSPANTPPVEPLVTTEEEIEGDDSIISSPEKAADYGDHEAVESPIEEEGLDETSVLEDPTAPIGITPIRGDHVAAYPNDSVVRTVERGERLHLVQVEDSKGSRWMVLKKGEVGYFDVAILSPENIQDISDRYGLPFITPISLVKSRYSDSWTLGSGRPELLREESVFVFMDPNSNKLSFTYGNQVTEDFSSGYMPLLRKFLHELYPDARTSIRNYDEIMADPDKFVTFRMYKTTEQRAKDFPVKLNPNPPKLGRHYMVISGVELVNGGTLRKMFIELEPARLSKGKAWDEISKEASGAASRNKLEDLLEHLNEFQGLLRKTTLPGAYNQLAPGVGFTNTNGDVYYPFHKFITVLSDAFANNELGNTPTEIKVATDQYNATMKSHQLPTLTYDQVKHLTELARKIDILIHGNGVKFGNQRRFGGKAQYVMDRVAAANFVAVTSKGEPIIMRSTRPITKNGKTSDIITGLPLLGPVNFEVTDLRSQRPAGRSKNPSATDTLVQMVKDKVAARPEWAVLPAFSDLLSGNVVHQTPMTLEQLNEVFGKPSFDHLNEGFGLRMPVYPESFSVNNQRPASEINLHGQVVSKLKRINPTRVAFLQLPSEKSVLSERDNGFEAQSPDEMNRLQKQIRLEREKVDLSKFEDSTIEQFQQRMGQSTPEQAVLKYIENLETSGVFETKNNSFMAKLASALNEHGLSTTLRQKLERALLESLDVQDYKGFAGRDYMKAFISAILTGRTGRVHRNTWRSIAQFYHNPANQKDVTRFAAAVTAETSLSDIAKQAKEIEEAVKQIAKAYGVEFKAYGEIKTTEDLLPFVLNISSKFSSAFRTNRREAQADLPEFEDIADNKPEETGNFIEGLEQVATQAQWDAFRERFKDAELMKRLEQFAEKLSISMDDYEGVVELISDFIDEGHKIKTFTSRIPYSETDPIDQDRARSIYNGFFRRSALDRLRKLFFGKDVSKESYRIVSKAFLEYNFGKQNWGLFTDGVIYTVGEKGTTGSKVLRHEVFHKVFNGYLSEAEQEMALELGRKKFGDQYSDDDIEEMLADDFASYSRSKRGITGVLKSIFRKILRFFNYTYNNLNSLEEFFSSIEDGNFGRPLSSFTGEKDLNILKIFGSVENYATAKEFLLDSFEQSQLDARSGAKILTFEETVSDAFQRVRDFLYNPRKFEGFNHYTDDEVQALRTALSPIINSTNATTEMIKYFFGNVQVADTIKNQNTMTIANIDTELSRIKELDETGLALENDELVREHGVTLEDYIKDLETARSTADLFNETIDSDRIDPETKVTGLVKQRLLSIKYGNIAAPRRAEINKVFGTLLPLLSQIDISDMRTMIRSIDSRMSYLIKDIQSAKSMQPNVRKATAVFLRDQIDALEKAIADRPSGITFYSDVNHTAPYLIVSSKEHTHSQLDKTDKVFYYEAATDLTMDNFAKKVAAQTGIPYSKIKAAYDYYEQTGFFRDLMTAVASLRQSRIGVGVVEYKEGAYTSKYIQSKGAGGDSVIESDIIDGFIEFFDKKKAKGAKELGLSVLAQQTKSATTDEKFQITKKILSDFGIKGFSRESATEAEISNFLDKFASVASRFELAYTRDESPRGVIEDESSFVALAVALREGEGDLIHNSSYIRGDGQRAYSWIDASFQSSLLNSIKNVIKGVVTVPFNHVTPTSSGIKTSSALLANNLFVRGISKIGSEVYVDHDSMKVKGRDDFATFLYGESTTDYYKRNFDFGYLSQVPKRAGYYVQFLPVPSERRTVSGVEVKALKEAELDIAIATIIQQQANRPDLGLRNETYAKRRKDFTLPGLVGTKAKDSYTQAELNALKQQVKDFMTKRVDETYEEMKRGLSTTSDNGVVNWKIDMENVSKTAVLMGLSEKIRSEGDYRSELKALNKRLDRGEEVSDQITKLIEDRNKEIEELTKKVLRNFMLNFMVNQHALSQLIYGDEAFYKHKEDLTKRIKVFTATGDTLITDDAHGFPPTSRIGIIEDVEHLIPQDMPFIRDEAFRAVHNETDGFGFMLPEIYEKVAFARGPSAKDDVALKPVYAGINKEGMPVCLKYAVIVLTDDQIYNKDGSIKSPYLFNLRQRMRQQNLHQAVFNSSVKVGLPDKSLINRVGDDGQMPMFKEEGIIEIDNRFMRFQLNPAADVDKDVTNPSQLTAFMDTNGKNPNEAFEVHKYNSLLIELGDRLLNRKLGLSRKGKSTKASMKMLRQKAIQATAGIAGKEDLNTLLSYKQNGEFQVSMNLPIIADQLISSISSIFSKSTVGFKFQGSKLALQSEFGSYSAKELKLKFKDEEGFTEVFLPEEYREFFTEGDKIVDGIIGFRIPSTNYHSVLALKVKGFYKVPPGSSGNVVIAPSLITYFHGCDYDIDTLFLIRKEASKISADIKEIASRYDADDIDDIINPVEGQYYGASQDAIDTIGGVPVAQYLGELSRNIESQLETARSSNAPNLSSIEQDLTIVTQLGMLAAKNSIVHTVSTNLRDERNRRDLLTPISFERVSNTRAGMLESFNKELKSGLGDDIRKALSLPEDQEITIEMLREHTDNPFILKVLNRYDAAEDSVIETIARLEAKKQGKDFDTMSAKDILDLVNPSGSMSDFLTQSRIHYNTYSGISMTGISANTGKTLAYIHSASKITKLRNTATGEIIGLSGNGLNSLLRKENVKSLNELLYKKRNYEIYEREEPKLKSNVSVKVNSATFNRLSKNELNYDGSKKDAYKVAEGEERVPINIFETIDTIINLAIDNVKEQKLFVLGITNSNANAYLSMIGLGIPLNDVAVIFKSPAVERASKASRFNPSVSFKESMDIIDEMDEKQFVDAVKRYKPNFNVSKYDLQDRSAIIESLGIEVERLKEDYTGQLNADASTIAAAATFAQLKGAASIGEEMFEYAQLFSLLRGMPSQKSDLDNRIDGIKKFVEFSDEVESTGEKVDEVVNSVLDALVKQKLAEHPELKEDVLREIYTPEAMRIVKANFSNRLMSRSVTKGFVPSAQSVFESLTPLSLPHVFSAWTEAIKLQNVIESTFPLHSPVIKDFARKIVKELNINSGNRVNETNELVQKNFMRFISSTMDIIVDGETITTDMRNVAPVVVSKDGYSTTVYGADAWAQEFSQRLRDARKRVGTSSNELLKNLGLQRDYKGLYKVTMTADKTSNPETLALIREGYEQLLNSSDAETRQLAIDLYKYAIVSQGLYYSRTGLALIFPTRFSASYSNSLNNALDEVIIKDSDGTVNLLRTEENLNKLTNTFAFQFARNNPQLIPTRRAPVKSEETYKDKEGNRKNIYFGYEDGVYFDIKFASSTAPGAFAPKFVTNYSRETFVLIESKNGFDYYRKLASRSNLQFYEMPKDFKTVEAFDISKFIKPGDQVLSASLDSGSVIEYPYNVKRFNPGDTVILFNNSATVPRNAKRVVITSATKYDNGKVEGYRFAYSEDGLMDYTTKLAAKDLDFQNKVYSGLDRSKSTDVIHMAKDNIRKWSDTVQKLGASPIPFENIVKHSDGNFYSTKYSSKVEKNGFYSMLRDGKKYFVFVEDTSVNIGITGQRSAKLTVLDLDTAYKLKESSYTIESLTKELDELLNDNC